jgi:hypothetical protein
MNQRLSLAHSFPTVGVNGDWPKNLLISLFRCCSRQKISQIPDTNDSYDNSRPKEEKHRDDEDDEPDEYACVHYPTLLPLLASP